MGLVVAVLIALVTVSLLALLVSGAKGYATRWKEALRQTAQTFGLEFDPGTLLKAAKASGHAGRFPLIVDSYTVSTGKSSSTYTRIRLNVDLSGSFVLEAEGVKSSLVRVFAGGDIEIGVPEFDNRVVVRGSRRDAISLLNEATRHAVMTAITNNAKLKNGTITLVKGGLTRDPAMLIELTQVVVNMAQALDPTGPVPERLAKSAAEDESPKFRRAALEQLLSDFPNSDDARAAAQKALSDPDPNVRVIGAVGLGDSALETLAEVVRAARSHSAVQAALAGLAKRPGEPAKRLVDSLKTSVKGALVADYLQAAAKLEVYLSYEHLMALDTRADGHGRATRQIATALGDIDDPRTEARLIDFLNDDADEIRIAAATSLGRVGSLAAVEHLLPSTKGVFTDRELKSIARAAVDAIQSRTQHGGAGQLSVVEGNRSGQLSVGVGQGGLSSADSTTTGSQSDVPVTVDADESAF